MPFAYADYAQLMFDLAALAFQTDTTRVITIVMGREGSLRTYNEIGVPDGHHPLSHHGNRAGGAREAVADQPVPRRHLRAVPGKLKKTQDGDGTLLDHSLLLYGSGLSDSNRHTHENLPIAAVRPRRRQHQARPFHPVREADADDQSVHDHARPRGVKAESIGDSTGQIDHAEPLTAGRPCRRDR